MTLRIEHAIEVDAAAEAVWTILSDLRGWPSWTPTVLELIPEGSSALAVGNRFVIRQPKMPRLSWEVTAVDEGRSFTWMARSPGLVTTATHEIEPTGEGVCRLHLGIEQSGPLASTLGRLGAGRTRRYVSLEAEGLAARAGAS